MNRIAALALSLTLLALPLATAASANSYTVTINGQLIHPLDAAYLGIPPGHYWLDLVTGAYGLVGGPLLGYVGHNAGGTGLEPGFNEITIGGGSLMSDGQCSSIEGVPVGNC